MKTDFKFDDQNMKKTNPFVVPEFYFDELHQDIVNKCLLTQSKSKTYSLFNKRVLAYAASIILIIGISLSTFFLSDKKEKTNSNNLSDSYSENLINIADLHEIDEKCLIDFIIEKNTEQYITQNESDAIEYIVNNTNNDNEIIELIDY